MLVLTTFEQVHRLLLLLSETSLHKEWMDKVYDKKDTPYIKFAEYLEDLVSYAEQPKHLKLSSMFSHIELTLNAASIVPSIRQRDIRRCVTLLDTALDKHKKVWELSSEREAVIKNMFLFLEDWIDRDLLDAYKPCIVNYLVGNNFILSSDTSHVDTVNPCLS